MPAAIGTIGENFTRIITQRILAEALDDRASFRRFCGFSGSEGVPERTAFVFYRRLLVTDALDTVLFEENTAQLEAKAVTVKSGKLVDATIIASASVGDAEARWVQHRGKAAIHGFKAHVGADATTALVVKISVTSANLTMDVPVRLGKMDRSLPAHSAR